MITKGRLRKTLLIIFGSITILLLVVFLFAAVLIKYFVEKYDEKYTGRQITMDRVYVNPLTGYLNFKNLKIFEHNSDSVFLSTAGFTVNFALIKLFEKTYEVSELSLDHPHIKFIQNEKNFNIRDLIEKFSSTDSLKEPDSPLQLNILNIKIVEGEFIFIEDQIPINYFIKNVNIESTGIRWNTDTLAAKVSFESGIKSGSIKGDITINLKNNDYRYAVKVTKFDLEIIKQYLKELTNYGTFSANLDADVRSVGNFNNVEDVTTTGILSLNDFHIGKNTYEDYASFSKLVMAIHELSPANHKYDFDSITVANPYFKYEAYDYLDNLETMFGKNGTKYSDVKTNKAKFNLVIEIADYVKLMSNNFFKSNYRIKHAAIYNGDLKFNDYSLSEKFVTGLIGLNISADSIDKMHNRVNILMESEIVPYGHAKVDLSISPADNRDFDINYDIKKVSASMLNPYLISYTSYPLDRGTLEMKGNWKVRNGDIQSNNQLVIIDPRVTRRIRNKNISWLPLRVIMSFIRESGNVIDYEIPITGKIKDPHFHLHDILWDLLKNVFIKPVKTNYRMKVKNIETEIEKSLTFKWDIRSSTVQPNQEKFISEIAVFLEKNPGASINVYQHQYEQKEKEYILFYGAKKKYYMEINKIVTGKLDEDDEEKIDKMSVKDSVFVNYLERHLKDSLIFTIQEKCLAIYNAEEINTTYERLISNRRLAFMRFFEEKNVSGRVTIYKSENIVPYNGFSYYKIEYKGMLPDDLIKAYKEMNDLNKVSPRKKFISERKKNIKY